MGERLRNPEKSKKVKTPSTPQMVVLSEIFDGGRIVIWRKSNGAIDFYNYGVMDPPLRNKTVESLLKNEWIYLQKNEKGSDGYLISPDGLSTFEANRERITEILGGDPPWRPD